MHKFQCNQLRPACTQCVRVKAECPGYRDPVDLKFRDQTQETKQKSRRKSNAQLPTRDEGGYCLETTIFTPIGSAKTLAPYMPRPNRCISPVARELVIPLFFHYFTVEDTISGHALIDCLPQTISTTEDDALSAAVSAVGYSLLANMTNSLENLNIARKKYGQAIRIVNNSLQSTVPSETCQVVRVVILLALFEVSSCDLCFQNLWDESLTFCFDEGVYMPEPPVYKALV
jgi:hypothetical protein